MAKPSLACSKCGGMKAPSRRYCHGCEPKPRRRWLRQAGWLVLYLLAAMVFAVALTLAWMGGCFDE